jgi:NADH/NAD ratio-sensing transcriptional regulator Rex
MLSSNSNRLKSPTVRKCSASQTQAVVAQLLKDGHRAMLVFTPCELHQYLKGRTLWLIG